MTPIRRDPVEQRFRFVEPLFSAQSTACRSKREQHERLVVKVGALVERIGIRIEAMDEEAVRTLGAANVEFSVVSATNAFHGPVHPNWPICTNEKMCRAWTKVRK